MVKRERGKAAGVKCFILTRSEREMGVVGEADAGWSSWARRAASVRRKRVAVEDDADRWGPPGSGCGSGARGVGCACGSVSGPA